MASKALFLLAVFAVLLISKVNCNQARIDEIIVKEQEEVFYSPNWLLGQSFGIMKEGWIFDELVSCHVKYPNGLTYEAYPNDNLPVGPISFMTAAQPFTNCLISVKGETIAEDLLGVYEFLSLVHHQDERVTLTQQSFLLQLK